MGTDDLTVRWYDGLWHEIYNEPERAQPLATCGSGSPPGSA